VLRRATTLALASLFACAGAGGGSAFAQSAPPVPARSADAFVDSVGVNTHLHFDGTPYVNAFDTVIRPKLLALGIRHVRDGAYTDDGTGPNTLYYQHCRSLAAAGVRFDLQTAFTTVSGAATRMDRLGAVDAWCNGAVEAFEGPSEPDLRKLPPGSPPWPQQTIATQTALHSAVRGDPSLSNVAVIGPAIAFRPEAVGDLSAQADFGNWHPFPGGYCPGCGDINGRTTESLLPKYRRPTGTKPMIATETGYHNALNGPSPPKAQRAVSELAAGKYMPRLLLDQFNLRFVRTYLYELIDLRADPSSGQPNSHFGLLRNDGSEKPAYTAVRSLLGLLADPGPPFRTSTLSFALSGQTERVHRTLLQKRDGRFFLALWQERSSFDNGARKGAPDDRAARRDLAVPDQQVTVNVRNHLVSATLHRLDDAGQMSSAPVKFARNGDITLRVSDRVEVLELRRGRGSISRNQRPRLTKVRMVRRTFAVKRSGVRGRARRTHTHRGSGFRYTLSERATVTIAIDRILPGRRVRRSGRVHCLPQRRGAARSRPCRRYQWLGTIHTSGRAGSRTKLFSGYLRKHPLKAGLYRARLQATDSARAKSSERRLQFRVVR
jgi:hypothetical protein